MSAPDSILQLVEHFETHRLAYLSPDYNETQVRREFIDPFFEALGWDVFNKQGYAEAYKDVIHEDAIKVGGATKAPDYCLPHRRDAQVLRRSQEARRQPRRGRSARPTSSAAMPGAPSCRSPSSPTSKSSPSTTAASSPTSGDKASTGRVLMLYLPRVSRPLGRDRRHLLAARRCSKARLTSTPKAPRQARHRRGG